MRSRAHIKGHPIHPMFITLPVGFGVGTFAFDAAGRLGNWPTVWSAGAYLSVATVISGLIASVPGLIDYLTVVPPNSSGKKRATYHMLVNVTALLLIALGWLARDTETLWPGLWTIVLEGSGLGLMSVGGWLGGTLAYRNQIGVDHRYAEAGKWKEDYASGKPGDAVKVANIGELQPGQMKLIHVAGRRIVLARLVSGYVAFDDHCTHRGGPLSDGVLACDTVQCPWHGSQFDVKTGQVKSGPAKQSIPTYAVEETDREVRLVIPAN